MNKYLKQLQEFNPDYKGRTEFSFFVSLYLKTNKKNEKRLITVLNKFNDINENDFNEYSQLIKKLTKKDVFYLVFFLEIYWRSIPTNINNHLYNLLTTLQYEFNK